MERCPWCGTDPLYCSYHDQEWGVPLADERGLFELLTLEGAQAGLSWITILRKREGYRRAFAEFDPVRIAGFGEEDRQRLLNDSGIVRNRLKIDSTLDNARSLLRLHDSGGSLSALLWSFVDGRPIQNQLRALAEAPAQTELSQRMSKSLKQMGFRFVGSTTCYALMQAAGMVNDHLVSCFRHAEVAALPAPRWP